MRVLGRSAEQKAELSWGRRAAWLQAASSGRSSARPIVQLLARAATRGQRALLAAVTPPQPPPDCCYFRPTARSQPLWGGAARFFSSQQRWWARLRLAGQNQSYEQSVLLFSGVSSLFWGFSCVTWRCSPSSFLFAGDLISMSWMKQVQLVAWVLFWNAVGQQLCLSSVMWNLLFSEGKKK